MNLRRENLQFALVMASKALSVAATSVITFCFVFPSLMFKSKKKILLQVKIILQNNQRMTENAKRSLSFLSGNKIFFLSSKTVLKSTSHSCLLFCVSRAQRLHQVPSFFHLPPRSPLWWAWEHREWDRSCQGRYIYARRSYGRAGCAPPSPTLALR